MEIILPIIMLLGAVGLFLFGMKTMSDALQRASGQRLYAQLNRVAGSPLRGILLATTATAIIQSSSAMTVMIVGLTHAGLLNLSQAIGMVMGANIGTTATANIAATMTNTAGKRAALAHLLFNLIATLWALPLLTPITIGINNLIVLCGGASPLIPGAFSTAIALALFHTLLNLIITLLLAGFIPQAVRLLNYLIPDKVSHSPKATDGEYPTPAGELGLLQTKYSLSQAMRRDQELVLSIKAYFDETNSETASTLAAKIPLSIDAQYAEHRSLERQIAQLAHQELSPQGHQTWQRMNQLVLRQEMTLELCQTIFRLLQIKKRERLWFTQPMRKTLDDLFTIAKESYNLTRLQLQQSGNSVLSSESTVRHQTQLEHLQNQWLQIKTKIETAYLTSSEPSDLPQPTLTIFIELSNYIGQLTHCTLQIAETSQPATPQTR